MAATDPGNGSQSPGSVWVQNATAGLPCQLLGPRSSLKLEDLPGPVVFVGDETSFALACALHAREGSGHLEELTEAVVDLARTHGDASLCITGKAQTIAAVRRGLKAAGLTGHPTRVKAYWDEHRSGLD